ncbi:MAG: HEAT repeat domain-containing protein [Planctomycetota bacterium]|nr:HEAT repeat domain-containing protein [Planctomycetota bacterium]
MKRILFSVGLIICAAIVSVTVVKAELPPMPSGGPPLPSLPSLPDISRPSYSPTPTPPDVNERRWERWWVANRAPLLVQFDPRIGETFKKDEEKKPQPTKSSYTDTGDRQKKRIPSAAVDAKKLNVLQLLVLLGYGGKFKEISRAMVLDELEYRGKEAVDELIKIAKGEAGGSPVSGISERQLQHYAIIALGEIDSEDVYEPLVEIYKKTEKQDTVFFASLALGRHGDEKAADVIINGRDGLDQYQRAAACLSLAMMGAIDKADYIKEVFRTAPSNDEKVFSALSLGILGSIDQVEILKESYEKSSDPFDEGPSRLGFHSTMRRKESRTGLHIRKPLRAGPVRTDSGTSHGGNKAVPLEAGDCEEDSQRD